MTSSSKKEDFIVSDITLSDFGRKEIEIAEHEMPGLMAIRQILSEKPLEGVRVSGSLHMTIQTAVLIKTLVELGAQVRWLVVTFSPPKITLQLSQLWDSCVCMEGDVSRGILGMHSSRSIPSR